MNLWMQDFAYQAGIGVLPFITGTILVIIIAQITVSFHAFRASNANPAKSLKYE